MDPSKPVNNPTNLPANRVPATPSVTGSYAVQETMHYMTTARLAASVEDSVEISEAARALFQKYLSETAQELPVTVEQLEAVGRDWYRVGYSEGLALPGPVTPGE
ncbi:MAG: hypothetical protein OEM52_01055 [bacterium]|nr:hypothetical protein [bacterium]